VDLFLFVLSAIASGPALTGLVCRTIEKVSGKQLVDRSVYDLLARIVGNLLAFYIILKIADTLYWAMVLAPSFGLQLTDFYRQPYGMWLLWTEILICGVVPAIVLLTPQTRNNNVLLFGAFFPGLRGDHHQPLRDDGPGPGCSGHALRYWEVYVPTVYEWARHCHACLLCSAHLPVLSVHAPLPPGEGIESPHPVRRETGTTCPVPPRAGRGGATVRADFGYRKLEDPPAGFRCSG